MTKQVTDCRCQLETINVCIVQQSSSGDICLQVFASKL